MLQEKIEIDKIEIHNNIIHIREKISILKNNIEIASSFNRKTLFKEDDRSSLDPQVKKIADALWS